MTSEQITAAVQEWLTSRGRRTAGSNENFVEVCELDSFDVMELVTFAEERFAIAFTAADLENPAFPTLAGLAAIVLAHRAEASR